MEIENLKLKNNIVRVLEKVIGKVDISICGILRGIIKDKIMLIYTILFLLLSPFILYQLFKDYENPDPEITHYNNISIARFYPGGYSWFGFYSIEKCIQAAERFKSSINTDKLISFNNNIKTITNNTCSIDGSSISETFGYIEIRFYT